MNGLIIWAQSNCRSTMALYREMIARLNVPALITLWHYKGQGDSLDLREKVGFSHDEFSDLPILPVGEDYEKGLQVIKDHPGWNHLFCVYQPSPVYRRLIVVAKKYGCRVGVMSESPCNMASGFGGFLKAAYMRIGLPYVVRGVVRSVDFFVNYSGDDKTPAKGIGWGDRQIIPFGYYPPPIVGTSCVLRHREMKKPLFVLATGILARYRGADVLVDALSILKSRNVAYRAIITQEGDLFDKLKSRSRREHLGIEFPGFVKMSDLMSLYETCDVYVGAGRSEPWGMRLNDALQCGSPLIVSRGMGGVQLVDKYACGSSFKNGDARDLAVHLEKMAVDCVYYNDVAQKAVLAAEKCSPAKKAAELIDAINLNSEGWFA